MSEVEAESELKVDLLRSDNFLQGIRDLLEICEAKNVEVPEKLKSALLYVVGEGPIPEELRISAKERIAEERRLELEMFADSQMVKDLHELQKRLKVRKPPLNLRVADGSFTVTNYYDASESEEKRKKIKIPTVYNSLPLYAILHKLKRMIRSRKLCDTLTSEEKVIMKGVNLVFKPGHMYLVLGAPGSGKSTLLKMIAGTLQQNKDHVVGGTIAMNSFTTASDAAVWSNLVGYIDQIDRLHPFMTVKETCEFAWRCRTGGTHRTPLVGKGEEIDAEIKKIDEALLIVNNVLIGLGLARVQDTFVGDQETVRGVSGGEKRRVTVAEMAVTAFPVLCADEISTGLDAATTYDIVRLMGGVTKLQNYIKVVSLLQPPPETFALFDGLILLSEGSVIYSGPVENVVSHFESLGYEIPERMDVADWLQALPTKDGGKFLRKEEGEEGQEQPKHLTTAEFMAKFDETKLGEIMREVVEQPVMLTEEEKTNFEAAKKYLGQNYRNSWFASLKLLVAREFLLWWRDKSQIYAKLGQDLVMGLVAGTLFWQANDDPTSVMGILFQSMFYVSVGAMLKVPPQFATRSIFYKHQDAHFFPTSTYVLARSLAGIPASIMTGVLYGTITFWFVGLAHDEGAGIENYFVFMLIVLLTSLTTGLVFSIFSSLTPDRTTGQACMAVSILAMVLFSGYTVQPDVIPDYWIWLYWLNFMAWALRGLAVNEFASGKYDEPSGIGNSTVGELTLSRFGFVDGSGEPFAYEWAWWSVLFSLLCCIFSVTASTFFLSKIRFATGRSLANLIDDDEDEDDSSANEQIKLPFQRVDLTFTDIHYTVKASVGDEKLELLKGIDGIVAAGKMTALMGSSGAGKTTLMDVLALRKNSGEIEGEVRLNGHLQEPLSFRRCIGYVEQFDAQSAQLTVRETCEFSAKLRLESSDPAVTPESTKTFVDQTLQMLELTTIQDFQVGDDASGGLSFEQRKRLAIAVELVSNPSIIFLDEPTSGLDARAASIVMRGLKRIALSGRAVCATIHQPSIAIFNSFDALLLLKRGGECVFYGDLGNESSSLIEYFERYDDTPRIQPGENPATWMLTSIGAGSASTDKKPFDYAGSYQVSDLHKKCVQKIAEITDTVSEEGKVAFPSIFATSTGTQMKETLKRIQLIYWRSPSYNTIRLMISAVIALLFGSIYVNDPTPVTEGDMSSRATTLFISFIFLGVNSLNTVLEMFETQRNMFYRHKASLMYTNRSFLAAFTVAEIPFILLSSMVFVTIFYFFMGFEPDAAKFFYFYLFFTLNLSFWTFLGQMFMSLTPNAEIAQGMGGLCITFTSLFTGILIRPENIPNFWYFMYWLMPGHYIFEGLIVSQYDNDLTPITATFGSPFYVFLNCETQLSEGATECIGTAEQWVYSTFAGIFIAEHLPWNIFYLVGMIFVSRGITAIALAKLNYRST